MKNNHIIFKSVPPHYYNLTIFFIMAGTVGLMVSELDSGSRTPGLSPGRGHCARHSTLTVPLSTQVYKWVSANLILGIRSGLMGHLARIQTLPTLLLFLSSLHIHVAHTSTFVPSLELGRAVAENGRALLSSATREVIFKMKITQHG